MTQSEKAPKAKKQEEVEAVPTPANKLHFTIALAPEIQRYLDSQLAAISKQMADADEVYSQRNKAVSLLCKFALALGFPCGYKHDYRDREWPVIFIDLPTGQVSWHVNVKEFTKLFNFLPEYEGSWDNHTTDQKHNRMEVLEVSGIQHAIPAQPNNLEPAIMTLPVDEIMTLVDDYADQRVETTRHASDKPEHKEAEESANETYKQIEALVSGS